MPHNITGLGNNTAILLFQPISTNLTLSWDKTGMFIGFSGTKEVGHTLSRARRKLKATFELTSVAERKNFFNFWLERKGSLKSFWFPTWISEFKLISVIENQSSTFLIQNVKFFVNYTGSERIFFFLKNGDICVRKVIACYYVNEDQESITVDTGLDRKIAPEDVAIFGRVCLGRFDGAIESKWKTIYNDYVLEISAGIIELPHEYAEV